MSSTRARTSGAFQETSLKTYSTVNSLKKDLCGFKEKFKAQGVIKNTHFVFLGFGSWHKDDFSLFRLKD